MAVRWEWSHNIDAGSLQRQRRPAAIVERDALVCSSDAAGRTSQARTLATVSPNIRFIGSSSLPHVVLLSHSRLSPNLYQNLLRVVG